MAAGIKAVDLRAGNKIKFKDDIWVIMDTMHRTPGKGQASMQVKMRSLTTGRGTNEKFRSTEFLEPAQLEYKNMQYLYSNDGMMAFMDNETFDQIELEADILGDAPNYMTENMDVTVQFHEGKALGIELPPNLVMKVVETEPAVRGDTVNNVTKPAIMVTGLVVQVPSFIEADEEIKVDTRDGSYISRARGE